MTRYIAISITLVLLSTGADSVSADDLGLDVCRNIQGQIEYYDKLRKKGGNAQQMESWKQTRERYKEQFREGNCKRWKKELR
ncbi:hypothetical protein F3N42_15000 [Marinihelvus fidelis]|uniref:DUF1311 domain-containing protein n=1 Tax=Marinihelvus fidelis TaxID=2613842 RepID=A0A5N0T3M3_9GAMM|nr:hypothetical protein [Marinihelvus fidelis]KAA9129670.1 hypothetical protein F3N42_15000 [Marinihelvus fidelis]